MLRRFALVRHADPTGVSGTGVVAYGVQFHDGHIVLRWTSRHPATSLWDSLSDMLVVHGHDGATIISWIDPEETPDPRRHRSHPGRVPAPAARHRKQPRARHRSLVLALVTVTTFVLLVATTRL